MRQQAKMIWLVVVIVLLTLAGKPASSRSADIETSHGRVPAKEITPPSSLENPSDVGRKAHTPLRVIVPDEPVEPPSPPRDHNPPKR